MHAAPDEITTSINYSPLDQVWVPKPRAGSSRPPALESPRSLQELAERYQNYRGSAASTISAYKTTLRLWDRYVEELAAEQLNDHRCARPKVTPSQISDELLADFVTWELERARRELHSNPGRSANKPLEHLKCWLRFAWEQKWIEHLPRFPRKIEQRDVAGKFWFTSEQLDALYTAAERLPNPVRWRFPFRFADAWTAAIVGMLTFAWDQTTCWNTRSGAGDYLLRVRDVSFDNFAPDPSFSASISYRRMKTDKRFCRPLPEILAAHLKRLAQHRAEDAPLFGVCRRPDYLWKRIVSAAAIPQPTYVDDDGKHSHTWVLKDLRKTCATIYETAMPGSAEVILGHSTSQITRKHYADQEPAAWKAIAAIEYPKSFARVFRNTDSQRRLF